MRMDSSTADALDGASWPVPGATGMGELLVGDHNTGVLAHPLEWVGVARGDGHPHQFAQREFLGIVSHEIKTSLAIIKTHMHLAERRLDTRVKSTARESTADPAHAMETARALLATSQRCIAKLDRMLDDVLDVARVRAGMFELYPEVCDLLPVVREVVEEHRRAHPSHPLALYHPARRAVPVFADVRRIRQVVAHYLATALAYTPEGYPVDVRLKIDGGKARVVVRSAEPGLPVDEQERIWNIFHQPEGVELQATIASGLGLGLHVSRNIVERHGGQVGVETTQGEGSTFWFTLPLAVAVQ
jgi:signal transduction histidine kinase